MNKCELCGRTENEETKSDHLRTIYIGNDNRLLKGFFRPYLTEYEFYLLGKDMHVICSNRKKCCKRRENKRQKNEKI